MSSIPACNFCQDGTPGPYDFATVMGPWGNGCEEHWIKYRARPNLGTGSGQLWVTKDQLIDPPSDDPKPMTLGAVLKHKKERHEQ